MKTLNDTKMRNLILSQTKINQIIKRIAYQIYENNMNEIIVLVGVSPGGKELASNIKNQLKTILSYTPKNYTISIDKIHPSQQNITVDGDLTSLIGKSIILCDDVLNSGRTLAYCLSKILATDVKKIETAVLILRNHGNFPIYATYKGYELSTTIDEHVQVIQDEGVFLQ